MYFWSIKLLMSSSPFPQLSHVTEIWRDEVSASWLWSWTLAFHSMQTQDLTTQGVDFFSSEIRTADRTAH